MGNYRCYIAVYGSAGGDMKDEILKNAEIIGAEIAKNGCALITGACPGIPYEAVKGAQEQGGQIIGYSPGVDLEDHTNKYGFPTEGFTEFDFVSKNYKHVGDKYACLKSRNISSVLACDAAIFIGGRIGSLNEFTLAYDFGKIIGILENSGGTMELVPDIIEAAKKDRGAQVFYNSNPVGLVEVVIGRVQLTKSYVRG